MISTLVRIQLVIGTAACCLVIVIILEWLVRSTSSMSIQVLSEIGNGQSLGVCIIQVEPLTRGTYGIHCLTCIKTRLKVQFLPKFEIWRKSTKIKLDGIEVLKIWWERKKRKIENLKKIWRKLEMGSKLKVGQVLEKCTKNCAKLNKRKWKKRNWKIRQYWQMAK